jgi:hypothetical protein
MEPEKQPLLGNGCVTGNKGVTVGSGVFCAIRAEIIQRGPAAIEPSSRQPPGVCIYIYAFFL